MESRTIKKKRKTGNGGEALENERETAAEDAALRERLIKSKERVQKHGEVFTPNWMVKLMLSNPPIKEKLADVHATFFEPSAGVGAFLMEILRQKLAYVNAAKHLRGSNWKYETLWALMSIYGIELLPDNLHEARENMLLVFAENYEAKTGRLLSSDEDLYRSALAVIEANIVQGNTLTHKDAAGELITFSEWRQNPKHPHKVLRVPFTYDSMFHEEETAGEVDLFAAAEETMAVRYREVDLMQVWREECNT